jgi:hypothetical protein
MKAAQEAAVKRAAEEKAKREAEEKAAAEAAEAARKALREADEAERERRYKENTERFPAGLRVDHKYVYRNDDGELCTKLADRNGEVLGVNPSGDVRVLFNGKTHVTVAWGQVARGCLVPAAPPSEGQDDGWYERYGAAIAAWCDGATPDVRMTAD